MHHFRSNWATHFLLLSLLFACSICLVDAKENLYELKKFHDCSIGPSYIGMVTKPRDLIVCRLHRTSWEKIYWLHRLGESNCVAVVCLLRQAILNPQDEFDYGPIPDLEDITKKVARALWGAPSRCGERGAMRYDLVSREGEKFEVDAMFERGRLIKYRLNNDKIGKSDWSDVRTKHPTFPPGSPVPDKD